METITGRQKQIRSKAEISFANAFHDYPMFTWCVPEEEGRWAKVRTFFEMMVSHGIHYGQLVATSTECEGAIHFTPPGAAEPNTWRWLRCGGLKVLLSWGKESMSRLDRVTRVVNAMRRAITAGQFFYIWQLGVDPAAQGKGHGKALIGRVLRASAAVGVPCYLETFKPRNVKIYEYLGFRVVESRPVDETPLVVYGMLNERPQA
jgi:ribosomal protein S18 acetylase RimI-like enzyme